MAPVTALLPLADYDGHMDWDGGWGFIMVIGMILFWTLVVGGVFWLIRELAAGRGGRGGGGGGGGGEDPLQILDQRLADGSITPDDYRERRAVLSEGRPGAL